MWELDDSDRYQRRYRQYDRKRRAELDAVEDNLRRFMAAVDGGVPPWMVKAGFIHHEPDGIKAIDEKGAPRGVAGTRLYLYPHEGTETIYLLTIGGKGSRQQQEDINHCRKFVAKLKRASQNG